MLCLLAVPATLNCQDLLNFVAPCHSTIQHVRIIRDDTPNQYMVLLEYVKCANSPFYCNKMVKNEIFNRKTEILSNFPIFQLPFQIPIDRVSC